MIAINATRSRQQCDQSRHDADSPRRSRRCALHRSTRRREYRPRRAIRPRRTRRRDSSLDRAAARRSPIAPSVVDSQPSHRRRRVHYRRIRRTRLATARESVRQATRQRVALARATARPPRRTSRRHAVDPAAKSRRIARISHFRARQRLPAGQSQDAATPKPEKSSPLHQAFPSSQVVAAQRLSRFAGAAQSAPRKNFATLLVKTVASP